MLNKNKKCPSVNLEKALDKASRIVNEDIEAIVRTIREDDADWTYQPEQFKNSSKYSVVAIFDEENFFIGYL